VSSRPSPSHADVNRAIPARASWSPTARLAGALAAGGLCVALGVLWRPLGWLGALWAIGLAAALWTEIQALAPAAGLRVRREVEAVISLGAANPVALIVWNAGAAAYGCEVRDEPPLEFVSRGESQACRLPAGGEVRLTYHVTPPRRGDFAFGAITLRVTGSYGLVRRQVRVGAEQPVKVYPRLTEIREHELALRKERRLETGVHMARLRGVGLEFESLRDYLPGDELRRVDWKATARHGELLTREYEVERSQHIVLCLDLGRTMASRLGLLTKVDHAVNAAALLAYVAAGLGDWVGLYSFGEAPAGFTPPRKHQFSQVLDSLYGLQPQAAESDYYQAFVDISHRLRKRALVVLFTDLPDADSSARLLRHVRLLTRRHLVLCAALSDYELHALSRRSPRGPRDLYERTVATALLADRERALAALRETGAIALDATPTNLSIEVLNRYLKIKAQSAL